MSVNPSSWRRYTAWQSQNGAASNSDTPDFGAFYSRYRFASGFIAFEVDPELLKISNSFEAMFRIAIAFSTVEALDKAAKILVPMQSGDLAADFRAPELKAFRAGLRRGLSGRYYLDALDRIETDEECDDLRNLVKRCRNIVFHSEMSPTRLGIANAKKAMDFVNTLSEFVLQCADASFSRWVDDNCR